MRHFLFAAAALAAFATPAVAETIAITGGRVVVGDGTAPIDGGTVIIRDGNVIAAGASVAVPADARRIDAKGKWVTPGVFAGFTRLGLSEVDAVKGTNDKSGGKSGFSAAIDVAPAIDPFRSPFAVNRAAGVTRAVVAPEAAESIFAGQGAIADLGADSNPVTRARAFQFAEFGEDGSALSGGSRAGTHLHFRAMLREAQDYAAGRGNFDDELLKAEDAKALLNVLRGETRLLIHVEGANDMLRLIELKRDFPSVKMVFVGASEGWRIAPQLVEARIPVIASALNDLPATFEMLGATQSNIGRMKDAGVQVAIGMINDRDSHQLRYTTQYAGNIVSLQFVPGATGLTWDEAFAAISSVPADIMGVGDRFGSLKAGKAADVVIWDGDPLELSSAATTVFIDGVEQPLTNRQNRLRDRYARPTEGDLPKAYDR
ncbi:HutI Imidazolonepropionase and related amidohydrolases [Sphingomonadaceae bacterium]|jgi:imidazolonepropionase-like amidohydrolase|uniref:amidohydrolase family protein n=1 Tax=Sphingorhabdus sp. TaxID=1902408 RepID=UPI00273E88F4|nr:amidohydrolase family protein [Sphingorhabdus sp.]MCF8492868.1 amidohydrolase family protein [Sphingomonadaceae bacterium]MCF8496825.1 amidohydrolase family protein [Sphingomonadaceae bacterium]MDP4926526.1 amidohydrolase family protein [Sphingorhabdus sp.]